MSHIIKIKGMHCSSCEILLTEALQDAGINVLSANYKKGEIQVEEEGKGNKMDVIRKAVKKEGYEVMED